jgi:hypothetical protein
MDRVGMAVGPYTLAAPAEVPEAGTWYVARRLEGEGPVWVRVRAEGEEERSVETAWERVRYLEHELAPRALCYDRSAAALAMGAPAGVSLQVVLDNRQQPDMMMTPATVLAVGVALADLIVHAHERGRPHGHLSPRQIWLSPQGELQVWGYGVGPDSAPDPAWCSPERARGRRASGDADQWALAAILAALVTGRSPWRSEDPAAEARVGDATHLWSPVMDQWKPLGRVLERALAPEARDRFPSAHPMRQALQALQQRVRQPDDLARIGVLLAERHGLPGAAAAAFAEVPRRQPVAPAGPEVEDSGPVPVRPDAVLTVVPVSPRPATIEDVPSADDVPTASGEDAPRPLDEPELERPLVRPLEIAAPPTSPTAVPEMEGDGGTSWENVPPATDGGEDELVNRIPVEVLGPPPAVDIVKVAPWVVATMIAMVGGYLLAAVW